MIEYGDMFLMRAPGTGDTLLMAVNPPIYCEHCGEVLYDWTLGEEDKLYCPRCGLEIKKFLKVQCRCGEADLVTLAVAANNDFGMHIDDDCTPYNEKVNRLFTECEKSIMKQVGEGRLHKCTKSEIVDRKRRLLWTESDEYVPGSRYPQWVIDAVPDEDE